MKAYLFDIDGVLTDPIEKKVTEENLFDQLIERLRRGSPVCINTGRSIAWIVEKVIAPLKQKIDEPKLLAHFLVIGEKGGTWAQFDEGGEMQHGKTEGFSVPHILVEGAKKLLPKYEQSMFFDASKETMVSIEMHKGYSLEGYHQQQQLLNLELKELLVQTNNDTAYVIEPSVIATDIQKKEAGKGSGAKEFLDFLATRHLSPTHFLTFGDSASDIEMADHLFAEKKQVEFIFVGKKHLLSDIKRDYPITVLDGYSQGTVAYLQMEKG